MKRAEVALAALSAAEGGSHTPIQVQKLFFLIDRELGGEVGGPHFDFVPYNYGPFDADVYGTLEALAEDGLVDIDRPHNWREFRLTPAGQERGKSFLASLPEHVQAYIRQFSEFVRECSFSELVRAIYKAYPEMSANSVFKG